MKPPQKLKVLLLLWLGYIICSLIFPVVLVVGFITSLPQGDTPAGVSILFVVIFAVVFGIQLAFLSHLRELWAAKTSNDLFLRVMAGLQLLSFPFGTALGVATYIILKDMEVRTYLNHGVAPMTKEKLLADVEKLKHGDSR